MNFHFRTDIARVDYGIRLDTNPRHGIRWLELINAINVAPRI